MSIEQVILEVKINYDPIIKNLKKYEAFMNHWFERSGTPLMAIETMNYGVLYFFKSIEILIDFIDEIIDQLESLKESSSSTFLKQNVLLNFFINRVIRKKKYPENGIAFSIKIIGMEEKIQQFWKRYDNEFVTSILNKIHPDIIYSNKINDIISLKFSSYESIIAFGNFLFYFVYKIE